MFSETQRCTPEEVRRITSSLKSDPNAAAYAILVEDGQLDPRRVTAPDRTALGELSTILENLGTGSGRQNAFALTGHRRFLVDEARRFWAASTGDEAKLALLEQYVVDAERGTLRNKTIVLLDHPTGIHIIDGNKRAIALYEANPPTTFPLPMFVLYGGGGSWVRSS
jgi:hypothetical protein